MVVLFVCFCQCGNRKAQKEDEGFRTGRCHTSRDSDHPGALLCLLFISFCFAHRHRGLPYWSSPATALDPLPFLFSNNYPVSWRYTASSWWSHTGDGQAQLWCFTRKIYFYWWWKTQFTFTPPPWFEAKGQRGSSILNETTNKKNYLLHRKCICATT